MDFINHTDSSITAIKRDTRKADEMSPITTEAKLVKTPLEDITNTQALCDNSEMQDVVKKKPSAFYGNIAKTVSIKTPTDEQADGYPSPSTGGEVSQMIEEPASSAYRHESTGTHFTELPISEDSNGEMTSVASERIELNPEAPAFAQQRATEEQSIGSPSFEVNTQDISCFDCEEAEHIEESHSRQEAVERQHLYYSMHEVWNNESVPFYNNQTSSAAEGYPPNNQEAAGHQSANASASEDETGELYPINDKAYALTQEATEKQSADTPCYEAVNFQYEPAYYDYLDTILEESESDHDEAIKAKSIQENITNSATSSPFESSVASSNESATNESGVIDSYISDTLEISTTIVDPDTPNTMASEHSNGGGNKRIIRFDRNGDLYLKVGTNHPRNMLVDSRALGRASVKLHAVISESAKGNNGDQWTIEFPDDDPKSFAILLNLVHARFEKVPAIVTLDRLFGVCTLASRYDMTSVLRPVAERWYMSARTIDIGSIFKMAFIAWELGFATDFGEIVGYITHNCSLDDDSELVFGHNKERLKENEIIQKLPIMKCQGLSELILSCSVSGKLCGSRHGRSEICLMLGKMFSKAEEEGVMDLFTPGSMYQHCGSLSMSLATLERNISSVAEYMDVCGSCIGVFELLTEVRTQFGRAGDPLYLHHIHTMAKQAKKVQMGAWSSEDEKDED
ncbi:hypothetical protein ACHAPO_001151 [Fusarium lateritium]